MKFWGKIKGLTAKEAKHGVVYEISIQSHLDQDIAAQIMGQIGETVLIQVEEPQTDTPLRASYQQLSLEDAQRIQAEEAAKALANENEDGDTQGHYCTSVATEAVEFCIDDVGQPSPTGEVRTTRYRCAEHVAALLAELTVLDVAAYSTHVREGRTPACDYYCVPGNVVDGATLTTVDAAGEPTLAMPEGIAPTVAPCGKPAIWRLWAPAGDGDFVACDAHKNEYDPSGQMVWSGVPDDTATCEVLVACFVEATAVCELPGADGGVVELAALVASDDGDALASAPEDEEPGKPSPAAMCVCGHAAAAHDMGDQLLPGEWVNGPCWACNCLAFRAEGTVVAPNVPAERGQSWTDLLPTEPKKRGKRVAATA